MDCRAFRKNHVAFVDDVLSIAEMRAMEQHRTTCSACSRQDTMVRRSLLLIRNLRPIEPSPDFMARLNERLDQLGPAARVDVVRRPQYYSTAALTAVAAGLIAVAYMAVETTQYFSPTPEARVAPMIASVPAFEAGSDIRERSVRRVDSDWDGGVARDDDGGPGADALRESRLP